MKNIFGKEEYLNLYNKDGNLIYEYYKYSDGYKHECACECTYDLNGKALKFKNSYGYSSEYTRDLKGNELTYENSNGTRRGFDIPEYTMEDLVEKIGNFKIKK